VFQYGVNMTQGLAKDQQLYRLYAIFFFLLQRAQPEIVTFLGYESDNALYSIPGKHIVKPVSL